MTIAFRPQRPLCKATKHFTSYQSHDLSCAKRSDWLIYKVVIHIYNYIFEDYILIFINTMYTIGISSFVVRMKRNSG